MLKKDVVALDLINSFVSLTLPTMEATRKVAVAMVSHRFIVCPIVLEAQTTASLGGFVCGLASTDPSIKAIASFALDTMGTIGDGRNEVFTNPVGLRL